MTESTADAASEDRSPTTLPAGMNLSLTGFDSEEQARAFGNAFYGTLLELSRYLDLERMAGATVTWDLDAAFAAIDRGFDARPISYSKSTELRCIAKCIPVLRNGVPHHHVVWHAHYVMAIMNPDHEHHLFALHVMAHECGHVVDLKWRDEAFPGAALKQGYPSHVMALLDGTALAAWEEYAACRMTADFSDTDDLRATYAKSLTDVVNVAHKNANSAILAYRNHGNLDQVLSEAGAPLCEPLRIAGYLLGHLDGLAEEADLAALCPEIADTPYLDFIRRLQIELRAIWSARDSWTTVDQVFAGVREVANAAVASGGLHIEETTEGPYVRIPFTAKTYPGGALGMTLAGITPEDQP